MKKTQNTIPKTDSAMRIGTRFTATVRLVRPEAVYTEKECDWSGSIASSLWGTRDKRKASLAKIVPGDRFAVEVAKCHPETRSLELVPVRNAACTKRVQRARKTRKSSYKTDPKGTTFLFDLSNLFSAIKGYRGAEWVEAIAKTLASDGYEARFIVERRNLIWASHQQKFAEDAKQIRDLASQSALVTVIDGDEEEADLTIMQVATAIPGSVCVSRDRFQDYRKEYPDIAGTDRVRSFKILKVAGRKILSIAGIHTPIVLEDRQAEPMPKERKLSEINAEPIVAEKQEDGTAPQEDILSESFDSRECVHFANGDNDVISIGRNVSRGNPEFFYDLADQYADGDETDRRLARKYEKLGRALAKRRQEVELREKRRFAELRRKGGFSMAHFSKKRIKAMKLMHAAARLAEANMDLSLNYTSKTILKKAANF